MEWIITVRREYADGTGYDARYRLHADDQPCKVGDVHAIKGTVSRRDHVDTVIDVKPYVTPPGLLARRYFQPHNGSPA